MTYLAPREADPLSVVRELHGIFDHALLYAFEL